MEDWLNCQIISLVKYRQNQECILKALVLSLIGEAKCSVRIYSLDAY